MAQEVALTPRADFHRPRTLAQDAHTRSLVEVGLSRSRQRERHVHT